MNGEVAATVERCPRRIDDRVGSADPAAVAIDACARDGRWTFLYTAAPLKIYGASGSPTNPVIIR